MNLGDIYLKTALLILAGSTLLPVVVAWTIHRLKKWSWNILLPIALLVACVLTIVGLNTLHHPLFVAWHRAQNTTLPPAGCVRYEPTATRLLAAYRMSRPAFDRWVADYPWKLMSLDPTDGLILWDSQNLGFSKPEATFATERAPNGKQLRVYYERGIMYLSYNAM
ncbi:MAG TPA: hypothetical protein VJL29_11560 [Thermoguttaceae bacterium]|nr:hypothetical protein [Thermoguttaceae bacterium]